MRVDIMLTFWLEHQMNREKKKNGRRSVKPFANVFVMLSPLGRAESQLQWQKYQDTLVIFLHHRRIFSCAAWHSPIHSFVHSVVG